MPEEKTSINIKKDVGARFNEFRKEISKTQQELAEELGIYQSTITNFELGKTFPNLNYLYYFHVQYGLDINWLISGKGEKIVPEYHIKPNGSMGRDFFPTYQPNTIKKFAELLFLLEIPIIAMSILAKLEELKIILKDEIDEFYRKKQAEIDKITKQEYGNGDDS